MKKLDYGAEKFLKKNRFLIFFAIALFLCGTAFGGIYIRKGNAEVLEELANEVKTYFSAFLLQPWDKKRLFSSVFLSVAECGAFFALSVFFAFALPFAAVRFFAEGFKLGGVVVFFCRLLGIKGVLFALLVCGFRLWFFVPVLILLFVCGAKNVLIRKKRCLKPANHKFFCAAAIALWIFFAGVTSLAESFLVPTVIKLCGFLQ